MNIKNRHFIFHDLQRIEGYLDPPDALIYASLLVAQNEKYLPGGVAEIGVFYGRSYFLLKKMAGEAARVLAIDLFDLDPTETGGLSQYERFLANGRDLGLPVDEDLIIKGDSTKLSASTINDKLGEIRFFSIDGGHMLHHVMADSRLAMETLAEHGIIVFDDTFNPAWPEVTVGVADFLRSSGEDFACFCMTKYKTYICRRAYSEYYRSIIARSSDLRAFDHIETEFLGANVLRIHNPLIRRALYEMAQRCGLAHFSERIYR